MELDWVKILVAAGITTTSAALTALVVAFLAQRFLDQILKTDLENHKDKLKTELETHKNTLKTELESHKGGLKRGQLKFEEQLKVETERAERIRLQMEQWANPIIDAVTSLDRRLANVLNDGAYTALKQGGAYKDTDWVITYDYFMPSTIFLFAQYFCWRRLLEESLRFDLFRGNQEKDNFIAAARAAGECLSTWPIEWIGRLEALPAEEGKELITLLEKGVEERNQSHPVQQGIVAETRTEDETKRLKTLLEALPRGDRQVFHLQQRAVGEALIVEKTEGPVCLRFVEFLDKWSDHGFRLRFMPLAEFLEDLQPDTRRWIRLKLLSGALAELGRQCQEILTPPKINSGA